MKSLCLCGVLTVCFLFFVFVLYSFLTICKKKKRKKKEECVGRRRGSIRNMNKDSKISSHVFVIWWTLFVLQAELVDSLHCSTYQSHVSIRPVCKSNLTQQSSASSGRLFKVLHTRDIIIQETLLLLLLLLLHPFSSSYPSHPPLVLPSSSSRPPPLLLLPSYSSTVSAPLISRSLTHLTFHFLSCDFTPRWQWSSMRR